MTEIKLNVLTRSEKNNKVKKIRIDGFIPAVIYGPGAVSRSLKVESYNFERVFNVAGETNLIDLTINDEQAIKVIIKDIQREGIKNDIIHVDFYQIDMNKKISAEIPFNFINESRAVQELGGTIIKNMDSAGIECLPGDLIDHIDIDLSRLEGFGDVVRIADLALPPAITITSKQDEIIISAIEPRKVEEPSSASADAEVAEGKEEATIVENKSGEQSDSGGKQDTKGKKGENKKEGEKK